MRTRLMASMEVRNGDYSSNSMFVAFVRPPTRTSQYPLWYLAAGYGFILLSSFCNTVVWCIQGEVVGLIQGKVFQRRTRY